MIAETTGFLIYMVHLIGSANDLVNPLGNFFLKIFKFSNFFSDQEQWNILSNYDPGDGSYHTDHLILAFFMLLSYFPRHKVKNLPKKIQNF